MPKTGLHTLLLNDTQSYQNKYLDSKGDQLNLIMLVALIITLMHLDKTVVCLGQGTDKKGVNTLLAQLINAAKEFPNPNSRSVATMIMN